MEKVGEEWRPNEISTTFRLQFDGDQPVCFSYDGRFYSEVCGLGWRYYIIADAASRRAKTTTADSSFEIHFDSYLISQARYGELKLSVYQASNYVMTSRRCFVLPVNFKDPTHCVLASFILRQVSTNSLFGLTVTLPSDLRLSLPTSIPPTTVRALNDALLGTSIIDARFYLFSARTISHIPCRPRALFVNSSLLKGHSLYLDTLLFDDSFKESAFTDFSIEAEPKINADGYDYESDSDLESLQEEGVLETCGNDSSHISEASDTQINSPMINGSVPASPSKCSQKKKHYQGSGRTVVIQNMAYRTWNAFLFYIYTGEIVFSPLMSKLSQLSESSNESVEVNSRSRPSCSPKSMYRLADQLGMETLKELAFQAILANLSEHNITRELFSEFTDKFPHIKETEMKMLLQHHASPAVDKQFREILQEIAEGSSPLRQNVIASLFTQMRPR